MKRWPSPRMVVAVVFAPSAVLAQSPRADVGSFPNATVRASTATRAAGFARMTAAATAQTACKRTGGTKFRQFLGGVVGAWVGGLAAFKALDDPQGSDRKVKGDIGYTPNANTAYAMGSWVGSTAGAYVTGSNRRGCGSFSRTLLFTAIPSLPLFLGRDEPLLPILGVVFAAPAQGAVATLAFPRRGAR